MIDGYLKRYLETGNKKVIGKGRNISVKLKDGTVRDAWLSVKENISKTGRHTFTGTLHLQEYQNRSNNEESYKILDCFSESILVIDDSGMIHFLNRTSERLFGYKLEEILGQNINILMPEPYHSRHGKFSFDFFFGKFLIQFSC